MGERSGDRKDPLIRERESQAEKFERGMENGDWE